MCTELLARFFGAAIDGGRSALGPVPVGYEPGAAVRAERVGGATWRRGRRVRGFVRLGSWRRRPDFDAPTAERYGWINRAIPDRELDDHVDRLARRLATFDRDALATAKRLVRRHTPPSLDDYRDTLGALRELIVSPSTCARRAAVAQHAAGVGADFELRMGHHLGAVETATAAVSE